MEFTRYLLGRAAMLEEAKHLGLTGCQARVGRRRGIVPLNVHDLAEDADHATTTAERNRAHLDGHPLAIRVDDHARVVRARRWSEKVPREDLLRPARFLGRDD